MLEEILSYAKHGWPVLPCVPKGKAPLTPNGLDDATTDAVQIEQYFAMWPDMNAGIVVGEKSGLLVLDVDAKSGGLDSLKKVMDGAAMPATPIVETGGGGLHFYFKYPGGHIKNATGLMPGLDLKSNRGYVIVPPSIHASGKAYSWAPGHGPDVPPDVPPAWLLKLLEAKRNAIHVLLPGENAPGAPIMAGQRNDRLTRLAGAVRRHGASAGTVLATLWEANKSCAPPLEADEVARIAESVSRYAPAADTAHLTDTGNAERLVALYGDRIKFCFDWNRWLVWDGILWRPDSVSEIQQAAVETVKQMYQSAADTADSNERAALAAHAKKSESLFARHAMIELAKPLRPCLLGDLDKNAMLLTVGNGTIDLTTGAFRASRQEDLITKRAAVEYDAAASCPVFLNFLNQIFSGSGTMIAFVQKALGYSLTGDVREQCLFVAFGKGSNGKSTLLSAVQRLLGDYAIATPPAAIVSKREKGGIPNDVARLRGIRYTTVLELEENQRLNEPLVKAMTGNDKLTARFLHAEFFDFDATFKLFLGTNHRPKVSGTDWGIWRRIRLIPFLVEIPDEQQDKSLPDKLDAERPGILNWLIKGCLSWQAEGLEPPAAVVAATAAYRNQEDVLADFVSDCLDTTDDSWKTPSQEVYRAYATWCADAGERAESQRWLSLHLEERGFEKLRSARGQMWKGVALKNQKEGALL